MTAAAGPYQYQRQDLLDWAAGVLPQPGTCSSGLLQTPSSSAYFGNRKAFRLTGALPKNFPHQGYALYFYPASGPAELVTHITGNMFIEPYTIRSEIDNGSVKGSLVLYIKEHNNRHFIVTDIDFEMSDGTTYNGTYYLFTLPPIRNPPSVSAEDKDEDEQIKPELESNDLVRKPRTQIFTKLMNIIEELGKIFSFGRFKF